MAVTKYPADLTNKVIWSVLIGTLVPSYCTAPTGQTCMTGHRGWIADKSRQIIGGLSQYAAVQHCAGLLRGAAYRLPRRKGGAGMATAGQAACN